MKYQAGGSLLGGKDPAGRFFSGVRNQESVGRAESSRPAGFAKPPPALPTSAYGAGSSIRRGAPFGRIWNATNTRSVVPSFTMLCAWSPPSSTNAVPAAWTTAPGSSLRYSVACPDTTETMDGPGCECQPVYPPGTITLRTTQTSESPLV